MRKTNRTIRGGGRSSMNDKHSWDIIAVRGRGETNEQQIESRSDGTTNSLTSVEKDNYGGTGPLQRTDGQTYCLDTGNGQAIEITEPNHKHGGEERIYADAVPTLQARMVTGGDNIPYVNRIRRLTEIECERLQGFEDNWTQFGNYDGEIKLVSKTQRYKQMGNAVTKKMVQIIGSKLLSTIQ